MINHKLWIGVAATTVMLVVRGLNSDGLASVLTRLRGKPTALSGLTLTWLVLLFGGLAAVLDALMNGSDLENALATGWVSAATAAFTYDIGKNTRESVRKRAGKAVAVLVLVSFSVTLTACPRPQPNPQPDGSSVNVPNLVDAGGRIVGGVCDLVTGLDDSGTVRSVCATAEEIVSMIAFISTLRQSPDAGARAMAERCDPLPRTEYCATSSERAQAIKFIVQIRAARFVRDGGTR